MVPAKPWHFSAFLPCVSVLILSVWFTFEAPQKSPHIFTEVWCQCQPHQGPRCCHVTNTRIKNYIFFSSSQSGGLRFDSLIKEAWMAAMAEQQAPALWQEATHVFSFQKQTSKIAEKVPQGSSGTFEQGLWRLLSPAPRGGNALRAFCSVFPCSGQLPMYRIKISPESSSFRPLH